MKAVLACLLVAGGLRGQTIKATSQEVLLDLVVRDKKGHLVKDLKPGEITVTDDGAVQQVRSLRLRTGAEISTVSTSTVVTNAPSGTTGVTAAPVNPLRDVRVVTFAFDPLPGPNFNNERTSGANAGGGDRRVLVKRVAEELLKMDSAANFYWGVFLMGRGRINLVQPYTQDKEKLLAAVGKAIMSPGVVYAEQSDAVGAMQAAPASGVAAGPAATGPGSAPSGVGEAAGAMAALSRNILEFEQDTDRAQRSRDDFFALDGLIRELQRLPGRKTLVYFTKGLIIMPEFHAAFDGIIAAANRANVTIYCVDPAVSTMGFGNNSAGTRQLNAAAGDSARNMTKRGGAVTRGEALIIEHAEASVMSNSHLAPMKLAEDTGGFVIANLSETEKIVKRLSEEINTYYELTYSPAIETYDGHFRKIVVNVARAGVKVQSRSGYFALPYIPGQTVFPYEVPMLSALSATPGPKAVGFRAGVKLFGGTIGVVFDVPLKDVTMVKEDKTFRCDVAVLGLIKDARGEIVKKVTRDAPVTNTLDNLEATLAGHFIYTAHVALTPGKYTFESAVLDRESERLLTGVKKQSFVVPEWGELSVSSLTLVRKLGAGTGAVDDPFEFAGGRVTPELNETVAGGKGANIGIYLVAQVPAEDGAKLVIDFMQDGKVVARSEPELPKGDGKGRIHLVANVPVEGLKAGGYEVWGRVTQGGKTAQERMFVNITE